MKQWSAAFQKSQQDEMAEMVKELTAKGECVYVPCIIYPSFVPCVHVPCTLYCICTLQCVYVPYVVHSDRYHVACTPVMPYVYYRVHKSLPPSHPFIIRNLILSYFQFVMFLFNTPLSI